MLENLINSSKFYKNAMKKLKGLTIRNAQFVKFVSLWLRRLGVITIVIFKLLSYCQIQKLNINKAQPNEKLLSRTKKEKREHRKTGL